MEHVTRDFAEGSKKRVAELKFLIHDLRVEHFINNIIHSHVTLDTDLEIYDIQDARAFHSDDLAELKIQAAALRRAFRAYSGAVKNFSPDKVIVDTGHKYLETIQDNCELILNPLWGRFDRVISFLPDHSRSVLARNHYRNNLRWVCGVYHRIEYFLQELEERDLRGEFDVGHEIIDYTNTVVYGYIVETSCSRVEIQVNRSGPAVISANQPRFRRMYFNLVMNAVDALKEKPVGMITVKISTDGSDAVLQVRDNGSGMYDEKVKHLMRDRESLDGELHSLGFVFVRQTVEQLGGTLSIDSVIDKGTTITIRFPFLRDNDPPVRRISKCQQYDVMPGERRRDDDHVIVVTDEQDGAEAAPEALPPRDSREVVPPRPQKAVPVLAAKSPAVLKTVDPNWDPKDMETNCGRIIFRDYEISEADHRGCIFTVGINHDLSIDTFIHKPYERLYSINHEDLSPMLYESTIRGRLEESDELEPVLILKEPHSIAEYFDLKEIDNKERSRELYDAMVRDEYILIARKLLETGFPGELRVHVTGAERYFGDFESILGAEPFALPEVAEQRLSTEADS